MSVSARIASNYTKSARKLYFDFETKAIKILKIFETAVEFTANDELLNTPASLFEELAYILSPENRDDILEMKM